MNDSMDKNSEYYLDTQKDVNENQRINDNTSVDNEMMNSNKKIFTNGTSINIDSLNPVQKQVVLHTDGAVQVSAGAGSGKTRILTHRIAYLVETKQIKPWNILAITFTNKATDEMKKRLSTMLQDSSQLWISTFHALCIKILKHFIADIGYNKNFTVYGEEEKRSIIKSIIKEKFGDSKKDDDLLKQSLSIIGDAKSNGISCDQFKQNYGFMKQADSLQTIYTEYEKVLLKSNALDFDDLLIKCEQLLQTSEQAREYYQNKFEYIHVDEFQDTNALQYSIVKILAGKHKNIFVVGDEDQSIYGWRGANIANLSQFNKDFQATVYKLEQNYRSTQNILDTANKIIKCNKSRIDKTLWSDNGKGEEVRYIPAYDEQKEAEFVVEQILNLHKNKGLPYNEIAVLMRLNALTPQFEKALLSYNIPHKVYGGFKFFERKEVKDVLAYLKLIHNPSDIEQIIRIANFPKRGIGNTTIAQLINYAHISQEPICDILVNIQANTDLPNNVVKRLLPLSQDLIKIGRIQAENLGDLVKKMLNIINIQEAFGDDTSESESRLANIDALVNIIVDRIHNNPHTTLEEFLDSVTLYSDADDDEQKGDSVTLATMHSAKGLEWDGVFVVGLEEETFPSKRSVDDLGRLEEERRLMYVATTRAKKYLYLTNANSRLMWGNRQFTMPSRFLREGEFIKLYTSDSSLVSKEQPFNRPKALTIKPIAKQVFEKKDTSKYTIGQKVEHNKFGKGEILELSGVAGNIHAIINFDGIGKMTLALAYAPLQIIE